MCYGYSIKIPATITAEAVIRQAGPGRHEICTDHDEPRIDCGNRRTEDAVLYAIDTLTAQAAPAPAPTRTPAYVGRATDRQVDYIMSLLRSGRHQEGGFMTGPTTREGVAAMSKREASAYITSLTGQY